MLIDAHNHLQDPRFDGHREEIIHTMLKAGISSCVVNGTSETDWPLVATLAEQYPNFIIPSFGLHPWKIDDRSPHWKSVLAGFLEQFPAAGIGECGLDRWIKNPDLKAQHEIFRHHLTIACKLKRPLTIHCLQAWGPLMEELREAQTLPRFLLHSFNGSLEIARELTKLGAYFSFSGYFLHERKAALRQTFNQISPKRILLETDAPDMLPPPEFQKYPSDQFNHPANLTIIAQAFAQERSVSLSQIGTNTEDFFQIP